MKKMILIIIIIFLILSSFGVKANFVFSDNFENSDWVVMFYLCGDNLLSNAQQQTLEVIRSIGSTSEVNFAVLIDCRKEDDTNLYYIIGNNLENQEWEIESDMSNSITLKNFSQKIIDDYPSDNYALFISSNKGSGWQGVCSDDHGNGVMITMPELNSVLNDITNNGAIKLDVIAVETCLGGNLEFRYETKNYCDYFVGYADCGLVHPEYGFPYYEPVNNLVNNPNIEPVDFAISIVDAFTPYHEVAYNLKTAMSVTDQGKLDDLSNSINNLANIMILEIDEYRDYISSALLDTRIYGEMWDITYYIDFYNFLELLDIDNIDFINAKNEVLSQIESTVISKSHLEDDPCCGFNFYFPREDSDYNYALRYQNGILPSNYEETLFAEQTSWDEFVKEYLGIANNNPPDKPIINGPKSGEMGKEYNYTISAVDPEQDDVILCINWGDNSGDLCYGPYNSGEENIFSHSWDEEGSYIIKVKSRDTIGAESDWTNLEIEMPKSKNFNENKSYALLLGKIAIIEEEYDGRFRVLPIKMLEILYISQMGFDIRFFYFLRFPNVVTLSANALCL